MPRITEGKTTTEFAAALLKQYGSVGSISYLVGTISVMEETIDRLTARMEKATDELIAIKSTLHEARSRGGQSTSEAKAQAARANGLKGGRPKSEPLAD